MKATFDEILLVKSTGCSSFLRVSLTVKFLNDIRFNLIHNYFKNSRI